MSQKAGRLRKSVAFPFFIQMKKNVAGFRQLSGIYFFKNNSKQAKIGEKKEGDAIVNDGTVDRIRWIIDRCICGGGLYGSWIFKDQMEESGLLKRSVWRYPAWGTGTWKPDHIATVTVYYQNEDGG